MQLRLRGTLTLIAVAASISMAGCTGDSDLLPGSGLDEPSKTAERPTMSDAPRIGEGGHHGGGGHHGEGDLVACCFGDGTCLDLLGHDCMTDGGMPQGMGTECASTDCSAGGTVACCFADDTCSDLPPAECMDAGGMPQGMGSTCETADCATGGGHHGGGHHGGGHGGGG